MGKFVLLSVLCLGCVLVFGQNGTTTNAPYIICGPGQHYDNCSNPCTPVPTCQNPNPTLQNCSGFCLPQCVCNANQGLILDASTQKCVEKGKCPSDTTTNAPYTKCGPGQQYNDCTNPCRPVPTCQNPYPTPQNCSGFCLPQCVCDANQGLILDASTQTCVDKRKCPPGF
uniref:Zonadhesin-like n=1 Tax=Diabrotica virgifera virgifera TaxID=50390 RepID=A0A6P7G8W6_DIAVI